MRPSQASQCQAWINAEANSNRKGGTVSNHHKGMGTYLRILQEARVNGKPVGVNHHLLNRQFKEWSAQEKAHVEILTQTRTARAVEVKDSLKAKIATKVATTKPTLRDRYEQEQRAKIAAGYETPEWQRSTDNIPSRGNGL